MIMSNEQWVDLIKFAILVITPVTSITIITLNFLKEKSVGKTKVAQIEKAASEVVNDIEQLKAADNKHEDAIKRLDHHYDELMKRVWEFLRK